MNPTTTMKRCSKCKETKPTSEFYHLKRLGGKPDSWCKHCKMLSNKKNIENNPEVKREYRKEYHIKHRERHLINMKAANIRKKYNISLQEYNDKLSGQNHKCLICEVTILGRTAHLDHNHNTGELRGFLCDFCNKGLGHFRDDVLLLQQAIHYLNVLVDPKHLQVTCRECHEIEHKIPAGE